ncbi:MAG: hypothetical protein E6G56_14345 [Actinobacteria bacterium]|nr:MAG: hypothetical protein E6G56_14345 [Actinomycetota bacterium]
MMSLDYRILYREELSGDELAERSREWTLFISAVNDTERVRDIFAQVNAASKHWLVHDEYGYAADELPTDDCFRPGLANEAEFWHTYAQQANPDTGGTVCLDLTGFMRPHVAYFAAWMFGQGTDRFLALYTEPKHYKSQESTEFTLGTVNEVRQIAGFEGVHGTDASNDLLIIGVGFEDELIRRAANDKPGARKLQLIGLPSLHADMYQQSVLQASQAVDDSSPPSVLFAPANDPFVTAQVLRDRVTQEDERKPITNLYLAALGTKPQTLGFALYYLTERQHTATSMLFPYCERYSRDASTGTARIWLYDVQRLTATN